MKRSALALIAICLSSAASAQQYALTIDFPGGLHLTGGSYNSATLDLNFTQRYISVNGSLKTNTGFFSPATGTCFSTASEGVYCNIQVDHLSVNMEIQSNLSGTATLKSAGGVILSTTPAIITVVN